ncbi:hypothetical protein N431DRAFT_430137 [Stipitochalara longipes BDJ]|nr:hypothetical protein N431DRAFT_430137 [Stipitochalara longipes BDJ]
MTPAWSCWLHWLHPLAGVSSPAPGPAQAAQVRQGSQQRISHRNWQLHSLTKPPPRSSRALEGARKDKSGHKTPLV